MKFQICFLSIVAVGALIACSSSPKPAVVPAQTTNVATVQKDTLVTPKQRYSYALGMDMGHALKNVDADIDEEILLRSIRDQMDGKTPMMSDSDAQKSLQELLVQIQQKKDKLKTENALLRKVVEAARDVVGFGACHDENSFWSIKALQNTIENYEGWKKEGER